MFESVDARMDTRAHGRRLESHPISSGELIKVLIRLHGCLLFAYGIKQVFS